MKNFGFVDEVTVTDPGLNGKMSEFNAAVGLVQLRHLPEAINRRKNVDELYRSLLSSVPDIECVDPVGQTIRNYSYFPVLLRASSKLDRDSLYELLLSEGIHGRRYFYPLISDMPMYRRLPSTRADDLPVASDISRREQCLPLYPDLSTADVERICSVIKAGLAEKALLVTQISLRAPSVKLC